MKKMVAILILLAGMSAAEAALPGIASQGGRAAEFIDFKGAWLAGASPVVTLQELPDRLIVEFSMPEVAKPHTVLRGKHDDPALLGGESVEILLCPDPAKKLYYHIGFNPAGDLYTARCKDVSWEPAGLKYTFGKWQKIRVEIPYADLGAARPAEGTQWRVNFGWTHAEPNGVRNTSSWSGAASFHDIAAMGLLHFGKASPRPLILSNGSTRVSSERLPDWHLEVEQAGKKWRSSHAFAENGEPYLPLKENAPRTLRFRSPDGKILWEKSAQALFDNRPMLELDRYYYVRSDGRIRWRSVIAGEKEFALFRDSRLVKKWKSSAASGDFEIKGLLPGRYELCLNNHCSRLFFLREQPWKTPDAPAGYRVENRRFYRGIAPVFLLAGSPTGVMTLHHGKVFNLKFPGTKGALDSALGLSDLPGKKLIRKPATGYLFGSEKETAALLESFGRKQQTFPLAVYRLAYEAQMKTWYREVDRMTGEKPEEVYRRNAAVFKKAAPRQLTSIHIDSQQALPRFTGFTDVFELTPRGSYERAPLPGIAAAMAEAAVAADRQILLWWFGVTVPDSFCRTAEELRAELYLAVLYGGSGAVLHLGHGFLPGNRTRLWSVISQICGELNSFYPAWATGTPVVLHGPAPFHLKARRNGRELLLLAVNPTASCQRLKVTLPSGSVLRADFTPYEPRLFRLKNE